LQQDLTARVQEKYPISVGLILKKTGTCKEFQDPVFVGLMEKIQLEKEKIPHYRRVKIK